jgi:hypothetical protein
MVVASSCDDGKPKAPLQSTLARIGYFECSISNYISFTGSRLKVSFLLSQSSLKHINHTHTITSTPQTSQTINMDTIKDTANYVSDKAQGKKSP